MINTLKKYFELTPEQCALFERMAQVYGYWNERINVVSRKDMENFVERHILHSLSLAKLGLFESGDRVMDVGCGGGFPVVPLAVIYPDVHFTAVDSIGKKIRVVSEVVRELGLGNVEAHNCRAESLTGEWQWIVSRAVAPQAQVMEWVSGRWQKGVLTLKGGDLTAELAEVKLPRGAESQILSISDIFEEEFFQTKQIIAIFDKKVAKKFGK